MPEETNKWATPQEVGDVEMAFGGGGKIDNYLPSMKEIPAPFSDFNDRNSKWNGFFSDWFYKGVDIRGLKAKENIVLADAIRHLTTITGSYAPKHEHKEAAFAYLCSLWLDESSTWAAVKE